MSDYLIGRINSSPRITLHSNTEIAELRGENHLKEIVWRNRKTGETGEMGIRHVFLMLGAVPNTGWLRGCGVKLDDNGFICTGIDAYDDKNWPLEHRFPMMLETNVPGIFAAGDVRSNSIKRVASAVGEGGMAVSSVHRYLAELDAS